MGGGGGLGQASNARGPFQEGVGAFPGGMSALNKYKVPKAPLFIWGCYFKTNPQSLLRHVPQIFMEKQFHRLTIRNSFELDVWMA